MVTSLIDSKNVGKNLEFIGFSTKLDTLQETEFGNNNLYRDDRQIKNQYLA